MKTWTSGTTEVISFLLVTTSFGCVSEAELLSAIRDQGDMDDETVDIASGDMGEVDMETPTPEPAWQSQLRVLSTGYRFSCVIRQGELWCWGDNDSGQLGLGDRQSRNEPTRVGAEPDWVQISGGQDHACGIRQGGAVWCWGDNSQGQLGTGEGQPESLVPQEVPGLPAASYLDVGDEHTCAITLEGELWCWGENQEGQIGNGENFTDQYAPVRIGSDSDWSFVFASQGHTYGVRAPGALWCWGRNTDGQCGQGAGSPGQFQSPVLVPGPEDWVQVSAGLNTACGIRQDRSLWCWGSNSPAARLVPEATEDPLTSPTQLGIDTDWSYVVRGTFSSCALRQDRSLWCWGRNTEGQLGTGQFRMVGDDYEPFTQVPGSWDIAVMGWMHACVAEDGGLPHCAGTNAEGELGTGDNDRRDEWTEVMAF